MTETSPTAIAHTGGLPRSGLYIPMPAGAVPPPIAPAKHMEPVGEMPTRLVTATSVHFDQDRLWVELSDGRRLGVPLAWFPRLLSASPDQQAEVSLSPFDLRWDRLDQHISIAGLLAGNGDQTSNTEAVA